MLQGIMLAYTLQIQLSLLRDRADLPFSLRRCVGLWRHILTEDKVIVGRLLAGISYVLYKCKKCDDA